MKKIEKMVLVRNSRYQEFEKELAQAVKDLQFGILPLEVEVQYQPPSRGVYAYTALLIGRA
jgi:acyl-CoA reductase-like NAD-dependent aldehyde dehydrogenase